MATNERRQRERRCSTPGDDAGGDSAVLPADSAAARRKKSASSSDSPMPKLLPESLLWTLLRMAREDRPSLGDWLSGRSVELTMLAPRVDEEGDTNAGSISIGSLLAPLPLLVEARLGEFECCCVDPLGTDFLFTLRFSFADRFASLAGKSSPDSITRFELLTSFDDPFTSVAFSTGTLGTSFLAGLEAAGLEAGDLLTGFLLSGVIVAVLGDLTSVFDASPGGSADSVGSSGSLDCPSMGSGSMFDVAEDEEVLGSHILGCFRAVSVVLGDSEAGGTRLGRVRLISKGIDCLGRGVTLTGSLI